MEVIIVKKSENFICKDGCSCEHKCEYKYPNILFGINSRSESDNDVICNNCIDEVYNKVYSRI